MQFVLLAGFRRNPVLALVVVAFTLVASTPDVARAHGLFGHVHVTGWAIENLPPGELRTMFEDPAVFEAALDGAMLPDTGYAQGTAASVAYGEYSHWEPFIEALVTHVRETYGPTYDTPEERKLVAFLMGCAAHGLQDEVFDSTFLYEVEEHDGSSQENTDPGTDGFLVEEGYFSLLPGDYFPIDELLPIYQQLPEVTMGGLVIDAPMIERQVSVVKGVYLNDGFGLTVALGNADKYRPLIPWAAANYLDPSIAGSLRAEIAPTRAYMQAIWERLHGTFDEADLVTHTWPDPPRRVRSADHTKVASWITVVFGEGIRTETVAASLVDDSGVAHPFVLAGTRWGGVSRIVRLQPSADFVPGAYYTATIAPGAQLIDGSTTTEAHSFRFQVECTSEGDAACPATGTIDDPRLDLPPPSPAAKSGGCTAGPSSGSASPLAFLLVAFGLVLARRRRLG